MNTSWHWQQRSAPASRSAWWRRGSRVSVRMLRAGEQAGNLGQMMERTADFHDEQIARWIDWFVRLFEPLLMTFIGLLIGIIVILMYIPIFELASSIQ